MEPSRQKLSDLLHRNMLPPPKKFRPMLAGILAALLAAIASGMAVCTHDIHTGLLSTGTGVLVAMAIIRVGGYGKALAIYAAALTALSIAACRLCIATIISMVWCTEATHAHTAASASAWHKLNHPTNAQVIEFANEYGYSYSTRHSFEHYPGEMLTWFADNKPNLDQWTNWEVTNNAIGDSHAYTMDGMSALLGVIALIAAAAIVMARTSFLMGKATQRAIKRRQETAP
jgi:hypothetical protein